MNEHPSSSDVQQFAESELLHMLGRKLGYELEPHSIKLNAKSSINIDGFSFSGRILCEVYAHVGTLRGSQPNKLAADILKLNLAAKRKGGQWRKILLFADELASSRFIGLSWLAEVCRDSQIEIHVVAPGEELKDKIATAQRRQKMVNAK